MTEVNPPGWLQNAGATHTAEQMRGYLGSLITGFAVTTPRGGIHASAGTALVVTQNGTPNMSVNVGSGIAYIPGTESTNQGTYFAQNFGVVNLTIATAPGSGQSRIDLVVFKVQDSQYSGSTNSCSLAVVTGTASASPSVPSAPSNSLILAQIAVGANVTSITTSNITDKRIFASALNAPLIASSTNMPNIVPLPSGQLVYQNDTNKLMVVNGSTYANMSEGILLGGVVQASFSQSGIGPAEGVVSGLTTGSIVLPPGRLIRIEGRTPACGMSAGSTDGRCIFRIRETNLTGTDLGEIQVPSVSSTVGQSRQIFRIEFNSGAGATKVYCMTIQLYTGTGSLTVSDSCSLLVYDMGPASRVTFI